MQEVIRKILQPNDSKIVLCVLDGLGGLVREYMFLGGLTFDGAVAAIRQDLNKVRRQYKGRAA